MGTELDKTEGDATTAQGSEVTIVEGTVPTSPLGEVAGFTDSRGDRNRPTVATPPVGQRDRIGWLVPTNPIWEGLQRFGGFVGLVLTLPLLAIAYVLVKLTSPGPFLFAQLRRGYGGQPFLVYKIRTLTGR